MPRAPRRPQTSAPAATERRIHPDALKTALRLVHGDRNRLWFDEDGSVWTLNHPRYEKCDSTACPMCRSSR